MLLGKSTSQSSANFPIFMIYLSLTPSTSAKRLFVLSDAASGSLRVNIIYKFCEDFSHMTFPFSYNEFTRGRKKVKHGDETRFTVKARADPFGSKPSFNVSALAFTVMLIIGHVNSFIFVGRFLWVAH